MRKHFIFAYAGDSMEISSGHGGLIKIDIADGVGYFEKEKLIEDLKDLINVMETNGRFDKTRL